MSDILKDLLSRVSALEVLFEEEHRAPILKVKILREGAQVPAYKTVGAAGMDLVAATTKLLVPGERAAIGCGIAIEVPTGWEAQVRPRSGMAKDKGLTVLNTPGTIDCDYRGELGVIIINHDRISHLITPGTRIAQLVLARAPQATVYEVQELSETERGTAGFGSTGTSG